MLSFKEKREQQKLILSINKELLTAKSFSDKRRLGKQKLEALRKLGRVSKASKPTESVVKEETSEPATTVEQEVKANTEEETTTTNSHIYEYNPNRKGAQRKKENKAALALLADIDSGVVNGDALTEDQKSVLVKYSGTGGAMIGTDGKKGSAYEYYTPKPIAEGMWNLAKEMGFNGGKVLDPSAGVGIFGGTSPEDAIVDAVELNETSGRINQLINNGTGNKVTVSNFEKIAASTPDGTYDAVMTNVPFSKNIHARGGNQLDDPRYQHQPLENYFVIRSLEKLRPGGLAVFITPPRCISENKGKPRELRLKTSLMAEFLGAYRLPNSVFGTADADTMSDVIVFRKFSEEVAEKINELQDINPELLAEANVMNEEFLNGKYFLGEGKRFVLGDFVPKDPNKFRDVDRVMNSKPVGEVGNMLKKFGGSRINWALLNSTETAPIVYHDGDIVVQAGDSLQYKKGKWVLIDKVQEVSPEMYETLAKLRTPYDAFENKMTLEQAKEIVSFFTKKDLLSDIPAWLETIVNKIDVALWTPCVVALSCHQVMDENREKGFNYKEGYKSLSDAMELYYSKLNAAKTKVPSSTKQAVKLCLIHYKKKTGFSKVWRGEVQDDVSTKELSIEQKIDNLRYNTKSDWLGINDVKSVIGEDFDPMTDNDWCLSADGSHIIKADDYYIGNYGDLLVKLDKEIKEAHNDSVRNKLILQKADAEARVNKVDIEKMTFNLSSPYLSIDDKLAFVRRFIDPRAAISFEDRQGNTVDPYIIFDIKKPDSDKEKLLKRLEQYFKNGTITLGSSKLSMSRKDALNEMRRIISTANAQFTPYVKSNRKIMAKMNDLANDPKKLRFDSVSDETPLVIPGIDTKGKVPHGYQNAFVRKMGREFSGINAFNVGLGKTLTSLLAVQHIQSIGVKKKTFFVVPGSVLANWKDEAISDEKGVYTNKEDSLFIGLRVNNKGKATVNSSKYDEDFLTVVENRHSKIFMSNEAFERIRLKSETIDKYDQYLRRVDSSFAESDKKSEDESNNSKLKTLTQILSDKTGAAPYLEDMRVDSIVIDEAHTYKNSSSAVNTKSARFLSLARASSRGIDAQAKAWYIRKQSPLNDGVLLLTATPITNSPLEVYSMLTLASGHDKVNDSMLGIKGADDFLSTVADVTNESDITIDGIENDINVFQGLFNVGALQKTLHSIADIEDAASVGAQIVIPEEEEKSNDIDLSPDVVERLQLYKNAFRYAIDDLAGKGPKENRGSKAAFNQVSNFFDEPISLIGHPFNLINKMTLLIMDPELDKRESVYLVEQAQTDIAEKVISEFNKKKIKEKRRPSPLTQDENIKKKTTKDSETGSEKVAYTITVEAFLRTGKIAIDTLDSTTQEKFEKIADKHKLNLDVTISAKLASLLDNFKKESSNPRGIDANDKKIPFSKQIIFCDILPMHYKIKRALINRAGVKPNSFAVITGKTNNDPEEILEVSNGFNAVGDENKYRVLLGNKKMEVGINLQNGTQAIHHLTIGWTPDGITQRNGRCVRQGNKTKNVSIYYYEANGTFDSSKRVMVDKKSDWINELSTGSVERVSISGDLTDKQKEALINSIGDKDGVKNLQKEIEKQETEAKAKVTKDKQLVNISTIQQQLKYKERFDTAETLAIDKVIDAYNIKLKLNKLKNRLSITKSDKVAAKMDLAIKDLQPRYDNMLAYLESAISFPQDEDRTITFEINKKMDDYYVKRGLDKNEVIRQTLEYGTIAVNESSELYSEWQSEIDLAQSMIDESVKAFTDLSSDKGSYDASIAKLVSSGGKADIVNGQIITLGMAYIDKADGFKGIINSYSTYFEKYKAEGLIDGDYYSKTINLSGDFELYTPKTEQYNNVLIEMAQYEDKQAMEGNMFSFFSDKWPEVSQYRKEIGLKSYSRYRYYLPQPYFPKAQKTTDTPASQFVFDSQKAVVKGNKGSDFTVSADFEVVEATDINLLALLKDLVYPQGIRLNLTDIEQYNGWFEFEKLVEESVDKEALKASLNHDSEETIKSSFNDFIAKSISSWCDLSGHFGMRTLKSGLGLSHELGLIKHEALESYKNANKPEAPEVDDDAVIAIDGETYDWKEEIKDYGTKYKPSSYRLGYKYIGRQKHWLTSKIAFDKLILDHPSADKDLHFEVVDKTL